MVAMEYPTNNCQLVVHDFSQKHVVTEYVLIPLKETGLRVGRDEMASHSPECLCVCFPGKKEKSRDECKRVT